MKFLLVVAALVPTSADATECVASVYWQPQMTASGERFNPQGLTAAHRSWPLGSRVRVSYGGREVIVRINDRGPFVRGRCIDLSLGSARMLGIGKGLARVRIERIS